MSKYRSLEHSIRDLLLGERALESDQNDQIAAGTYTTKAFDMSPNAQKLYSALPKELSADDVEQAAIHMDKLFALEKESQATNSATQNGIDNAEDLANKVKDLGKKMNLEKEHNAIADSSLNKIKGRLKTVPTTIKPGQEKHPLDDPRFKSPPATQLPDPKGGPQGDRDVDNVKRYLINRSKAAQRKLKITDGD
jgi:hypothetical protein